MTEDRRNLLLSVCEQMYSRRCRCGRCDCIDSDPVEIARRILIHWSIQYRRLEASAKLAAEHRADAAKMWARHGKRFPQTREEMKAKVEGLRIEAVRESFLARHYARATKRYERLGRGMQPFVATPPIGEVQR